MKMKKTLAILNFIACIPVIVAGCGLAYVMFFSEPSEDPNVIGVIGGSDGPTAVFLTCQPEPLSILFLGLYVGLFLLNGVVFWKSQSTTIRPTEPRKLGPVA
jgi:Na+-transporting methylmalonyl-CoA/oxaloacetate decarboxylase beta subunit